MITTIKLAQCTFVVSFLIYKIAARHTMEGVLWVQQDAVQIEMRIEEQYANCCN